MKARRPPEHEHITGTETEPSRPVSIPAAPAPRRTACNAPARSGPDPAPGKAVCRAGVAATTRPPGDRDAGLVRGQRVRVNIEGPRGMRLVAGERGGEALESWDETLEGVGVGRGRRVSRGRRWRREI